MKKFFALLLICVGTACAAQQAPKEPATLKSVLLQQLRETHNQKNWFISGKEAMAGLTPEQAAWTDGKNHSVGQLVQHLNFWNGRLLQQYRGEKPGDPGDNTETFKFDPKNWDAAVKQYDEIMTEIEKIVSSADDAKLQKLAPTISRVSEHNAYHIGEILMVRKAQGAWNPDNGVK